MTDAYVFIVFRLAGSFDPDSVTELLGITPCFAVEAGGSRGRRVFDEAAWRFDTSVVEADLIEPHLDYLFRHLEPVADELAQLLNDGARAEVDCLWSSVGLGGGPYIEPKSMERLAVLGLPLLVSFVATASPAQT